MSEHHHCDCEHGHDHEANIYEQAFAKYDLNLNDEKVAQDVRELVANHREQYNTPEVLRTLLSTVELTTLTVTDSHENVLRFTESDKPLERSTSRPSALGHHLCLSQLRSHREPKPAGRRRTRGLCERRFPRFSDLHRGK